MRVCVYILAILAAVPYTRAQVKHVDMNIYGCSDTVPGQDSFALDGEGTGHSDFALKQFVMTLPEFADPFTYGDDAFYTAVQRQFNCLDLVREEIKGNNHSKEVLEPPVSSIYTRKYVKLGVDNQLICHVTGFFPPLLRLRWAKNDVYVSKGVTLGQFQPNNNGTFTLFSSLNFTPKPGDYYTCTVDHATLKQPLIKEWSADKWITPRSIFPIVLCAVGAAVGLLGIAIGILFFIKGSQCN
ncbi:RLA class II histocompatibility antigen, DP alpha-1 chain [Chanos chanos]|uniref:RLA class II histocompatibility antigen, DP alpha-1 chain n=1 Tax=Chanos chanos TaxID=29144 RepID=A0A6J2V8D3_CHACN|nr:RLA class II histocompatibility antigen, DP alpha-1 chain-like [Chanos chanos]